MQWPSAKEIVGKKDKKIGYNKAYKDQEII